jgi:hypothetical protein
LLGLKKLAGELREEGQRLKPCSFGFSFGTAEEVVEDALRSAEAFRTFVEAVRLGWRAQPGMAVPRGFSVGFEAVP